MRPSLLWLCTSSGVESKLESCHKLASVSVEYITQARKTSSIASSSRSGKTRVCEPQHITAHNKTGIVPTRRAHTLLHTHTHTHTHTLQRSLLEGALTTREALRLQCSSRIWESHLQLQHPPRLLPRCSLTHGHKHGQQPVAGIGGMICLGSYYLRLSYLDGMLS